MKKIAFLAYDEPRGLTYHFSDVFLAFNENIPDEFKLYFITLKKEQNIGLIRKIEKSLTNKNITLIEINSSSELLKLELFKDIDIVHCNSFRALYYILKLKKKYDFKIIMTLHAFFNGTNYKTIFTNLFSFLFIKNIDVLHFLSHKSLEEFASKNIFFKKDKINYFVFGLGINYKEFLEGCALPDDIAEIIKNDKDKIKLVYLANFTNNKNHIGLIKVLKEILQKYNCVLYLFGEGKTMDSVKKIIDSYQLNNKVILFGRVERRFIPMILKSCDIGLMYSNSENSPHGVMECLAAGLPVVSSNVGNANQMIQDFISGFVVELNDKISFQHKIKILILNEELRRELGKNAREYIFKYYKWDNFVKKLLYLYKTL